MSMCRRKGQRRGMIASYKLTFDERDAIQRAILRGEV